MKQGRSTSAIYFQCRGLTRRRKVGISRSRMRVEEIVAMSNIVPALGSTSLGIVIGWLIRYFIRRFKKFTPSILSSVISLAFGGVAIKFLDADRTVVWFYPIGVLLGFVAYHIIATSNIKQEATFAKPLAHPPKRGFGTRSSRDAVFGKLDGAAYDHPPKTEKNPFDR